MKHDQLLYCILATMLGLLSPQKSLAQSMDRCGGAPGSLHANGGGFVAGTAQVDPTAYVGPDAMVCQSAQVSGDAQIKDAAIVAQMAKISGAAVVRDHARVTGRARVSGNAVVQDSAWVGGGAIIKDNAKVTGDAKAIAGTLSGTQQIGSDDIFNGRINHIPVSH